MASSTPRTRTPRGDVPPGERAPLLRSDGSARPRSAVWLSVALIVAGVMVLAVGAAPRFWKHAPEALVNGALYRPEAAAEEAAVLEAEAQEGSVAQLRHELQVSYAPVSYTHLTLPTICSV